MEKKSEYKNALRSKRLIKEAFVTLLQEKPVDKITVTNIITLADINRGTFYAHFTDTRAVMEQIENELINELYGYIQKSKQPDMIPEPHEICSKISALLNDNLDFYRLLAKSSNSTNFFLKLKKSLLEKLAHDFEATPGMKNIEVCKLRINVFVSGAALIYQDWLNGTISMTLEEVSEILGDMIHNELLRIKELHF